MYSRAEDWQTVESRFYLGTKLKIKGECYRASGEFETQVLYTKIKIFVAANG